MKTVILCGGEGTRLREETEFRPKPMVEIGGRPILWHIMKHYASYGLKDFVLCLGYRSEIIKEYFYNYEVLNNDFTVELGEERHVKVHNSHDEAGWCVTLVETGDAAMTGARVKRVEKYIDSDIFMLTYGDGLADVNLDELNDFHMRHGRLATITGVATPSRFGSLVIEGKQVIRFAEKPTLEDDFVNGGFMVFGKEFFQYLDEDDHCVLERDPLERLVAEGQVMVFMHTGFWQCMDTYRDYRLLNRMWNSGDARWKTCE